MAEDSDLERTEQATPQRIQKAREEGQVARSQELTTFILLLSAAAGMVFMGNHLMNDLLAIMREGMRMERELAFQPGLMFNRLSELFINGLPFGMLLEQLHVFVNHHLVATLCWTSL